MISTAACDLELEHFTMGTLDALNTATSGLLAQTFALQNISGNLANTQTTAFKESNTGFQDMLSQFQVSTTVDALTVPTNSIQGALQPSTIASFMAINGDGYFTVQKPISFNNGQPVFDSTKYYTRRGDFQPAANGNLVNGAGYYLTGVPVDPVTGTVNVAAVPLVHIEGQSFLQPVDGEAFATTALSGPAQPGATGKVIGSELEASNTDPTTQLTAVIQTQQAYDSDSKVVTTSDQMLLTITNLVV